MSAFFFADHPAEVSSLAFSPAKRRALAALSPVPFGTSEIYVPTVIMDGRRLPLAWVEAILRAKE
jgi:hypothetical protein